MRTHFEAVVSVFVLLNGACAFAATSVGGFITTNTRWLAVDSPFIATSSVLVDGGATLTIDPGVEVQFAPNTGLAIVDGILSARGTSAQPITLKSDKPEETNRWNGIQFGDKAVDATFDSDGNFLSGSIVEHAIVQEVAKHGNGSIRIESSSPFIHKTTIRDNLSYGIYASQADGLRIVSNEIRNNGCISTAPCGILYAGGFVLLNSDDLIVANNEIVENIGASHGGFMIAAGSNALIVDNSVANNRVFYDSSSHPSGAGIFLQDTMNSVIRGNTISENSGLGTNTNGVAIDRGKEIALMKNLVTRNSTAVGLAIQGGKGISLRGDQIVDNSGHGIRFIDYSFFNASDVELSVDPSNPTMILGNGGYEIINQQKFEVATGPFAVANVDARNVWWGTTDIAAINASIFDFFDDSFRGIVYFSPVAILEPENGDFNGDGAVDAADYVVWRDDGGVQDAYYVWRSRLGKTAAESAHPSVIPEAPTFLLLIAGTIASLTVHRHRR
jgi:hypothetical protein